MSQHSALASLTATYTDSEGEDGVEDEPNQGSVSTPVSPNANSQTNSPVPSAVNLVSANMAQLVSYHDDTVLSDDEGGTGEGDMKEPSTPPEPEPVTDDGIQLPPEAPGRCSAELQEKIQKLYDKMQNDTLDMNYVIQQRKDFRNPSIYEKLIQFCGINELGTNYPPKIYDPLRWGKESYYEELAKVQKQEMDKREKDRKTKVEVVSGTRKSKWDQPAGGNPLVNQTLKPAGLVQQPTLTSSATGTKGTVISAFGSLPKKPRI